jgi:eukaryotic-like serine/threonine-protein kinase
MKKIGRYEIVEELGRGAMGIVYKASDPTIGRMVAIKLLSLSSKSEVGLPGAKESFLREARAAGRLSHPGIVTVHDALEDPATQSCYIVMEFVAGQTLERALLAGPPMPVDKALQIARQIAEALDYAHRQQIVHRDLKPANILLTEDGRAKITDFGIAKLVAGEGAQRTLAIMGTPSYMSPEQVTGGEIDAASDIFSLGILLYLMLTGEKPFSGDTAAVMFKIAYQDPAPPSQVKPELGQGQDFLLLRALAKDKKKRYSSAREFLDDLDDVGHGRTPRSQAKVPLSELRAGDLTIHAPRPLVPLQAAAVAAARKGGAVRPGVVFGAAAVALLLALGAWMVEHRKTPPPAPTVTSPATAPPAPAQTVSTPPESAAGQEIAQPRVKQQSTSTPSAKPHQPERSPKTETARSRPPGSAPEAAALPPPAPVEKAKPVQPKPAPASRAPVMNAVQFRCRYELEEGTLSLSADDRIVFREALKGRRKGKILGLGRSYTGTLSRPFNVPSGTRTLTVHVETEDGSINLTRSISAAAITGKQPALHANINSKRIELSW